MSVVRPARGPHSMDIMSMKAAPPSTKRPSFMSVRYATLRPLGASEDTSDGPPKALLPPTTDGNRRQQTRPSSSNGPVIDSEVPGVIRLAAASAVAPTVANFVKLPPLPESVSDPEFDPLLHQKLELCSEALDFVTPGAHMKEKEIKSRTLCEFIEMFENLREVRKLTQEQQGAIFKMLEKNILRQASLSALNLVSVDFSLAIIEPSWPHLFYCYQILNRFVQVFPDSEFMSMSTVRRLVNLTQLPDTNERMQLVAFLRTYFDTHQADRAAMLAVVSGKLLDIQDGAATPFSAMPLVILLSHMYSRSAGSMDFKPILTQMVLPLLGLRYLPMYYQNVKQLLGVVLQKDPTYATTVLRKIEIMWPQANGTKQQLFLDLIAFVCSKMPQDAFRPLARRVFKFFAETVASPHIRVVETSIDIWKKATEDNWIGQNSRLAIQAMFENVTFVAEKHWLKALSERAKQTLAEMCKVNKHSYHKIKALYKQMKAQRYKTRIPNDCQRGWVTIARMARDRGDPFDYHAKVKEVQLKFHNEQHETLATTRFIPVLEKDIQKSIEDSTKRST